MLSRQNGTGVEALVPFFMLVFLAESKTMASEQSEISADIFNSHSPSFLTEADTIMTKIASMSPAEISEILGISHQLANKAHQLAYDFPHKLTGYAAINGFTGEAFKGLDIRTIPEDSIRKADDVLRIISSIYGIVKPSDIIKPYRCEFNKEICPDGKTPLQVFKPKVTIETVNFIKQNKVKNIINLLPADAEKMLDWKIIRAFASVHKVLFKVINSTGELKTPIAKRLKELRGIMCRTILTEGIQSFNELTSYESPHFVFSPADSKPGLPVFITAE